jgi:hypothetical protein
VLHGPILADKSLDGTVFKVEDTAIITAAAGVLGAFVGGGAAIWAASVAADKAENAAVAKEERDRQRQSDDAVAAARRRRPPRRQLRTSRPCETSGSPSVEVLSTMPVRA